MLAIATASLNSRIRSRGLSAREIWTQRGQFTNSQIPHADQGLILKQHENRLHNHPHSERSKAPLSKLNNPQSIEVGDLLYQNSDRNKSCSRDRYLVVSVENNWCNVRKFVGLQLRNFSYRVKTCECYKVLTARDHSTSYPSQKDDNGSSSDERHSLHQNYLLSHRRYPHHRRLSPHSYILNPTTSLP